MKHKKRNTVEENLWETFVSKPRGKGIVKTLEEQLLLGNIKEFNLNTLTEEDLKKALYSFR